MAEWSARRTRNLLDNLDYFFFSACKLRALPLYTFTFVVTFFTRFYIFYHATK